MWSDAASWLGQSPYAMRILVLMAFLLLLPTGCQWARPRKVDPVVKIGLVAPFEGRHRDIGYDVIYSARLAIQETNEFRLPGQAWLALVALDDFGDPTMARQSAEAMAIDPDVVAVIGHWLPETTHAANSVYIDEGLPFVPGGQAPLGPTDPAVLDEAFLRDYAEITPFDEVAGPYAGSAYKGLQLIISAIREAEASGRAIDRSTVGDILGAGSIDGFSGNNRSPERRGE